MTFDERPRRWLQSAPDQENLADDLSQQELNALAADVIRTYDIDKANRREWDDQSERALKLAKQVLEKKSTPWVGASNVKHPLITVATIQFAARAYPEICRMGKVVKCQITGDDKPPQQPPAANAAQPNSGMPAAPPQIGPGQMAGPQMAAGQPPMPGPQMMGPAPGQAEAPPIAPGMPAMSPQQMGLTPVSTEIKAGPKLQRANRIEAHMNWQLTQEQTDWEADMDCLLHVLPVVGQCYKKTYFSAKDKHNISELVLPDDCVVSKGRSRDIKKARRISHRLWIYGNEAVEKMRKGSWLQVELGTPPTTDNDTDAPHEFIEQHRWDDLDGDGYKEPYIVTVHRQTSQTVRVAARFTPENININLRGDVQEIKADNYFTHYGFIPNPDGSINFLGFGQLLEPLNASINTSLNQLLDSGHLYNAGGGFIGRGVRMRGGTYSFKPGEWKLVDVQGGALKENIIPMPVREPSSVLFQLLGFLVTSGKEISSVSDVLTGETRLAANMPVGTAMALVEQGLKVFTGIYKRVYRSLTEEFRKIYHLNARFLEPRVTFTVSGHPEQFVDQGDYQAGDTSVMPIADPELSSDMQRLLKSQALKEVSGRPGLNEVEVTRRMVHAIRPDSPDSLLLSDGQISGREPTPWKPPPPPQMILAQAKAVRMQQQAQEATMRLQMDMAKFELEMQEIEAGIANKKADTMLKLANVDAVAAADAMEVYKAEMTKLDKELEMKVALLKERMKAHAAGQRNSNKPGGAPAVEGPPDYSGGLPGTV